MDTQFSRRIALLSDPAHLGLLNQGLRGIERETLRVDAHGTLARGRHPQALGSALTHSQITTDYAEALLEFITPAEHDIGLALDKLDAIHRFVHSRLEGGLLWSQSMPCPLPPEDEIEIGWYGTSHIGMLKHVYRRGLALRYGKTMQCIAGIHYNYSLPERMWQLFRAQEAGLPPAAGKPVESDECANSRQDYQSSSYFAMIRNFRRYGWLLMYLFGASPAVATNFLRGRPHQLQTMSDDTLFLPWATSLRMSDLGYKNDAQADLAPQENCLDSYVASISEAVSKPHPPYAQIGAKRDGEWVQLSTNILQIENEYYSSIRPKRVINRGERPVQALCRRGVQYIEVRCMDVDPFEPVGISLETSRFLDAFLLFCALEHSPRIEATERAVYSENFAKVVKEGRRPGLCLDRGGEQVSLKDWGQELLAKIAPAAALLDTQRGTAVHTATLAQQEAKLRQPLLTPSARVLAALEANGGSFQRFALNQSVLHADHFLSRPPCAEETAHFERMAQASLVEQEEMERNQTGSFDEAIEAYRASNLCKACP